MPARERISTRKGNKKGNSEIAEVKATLRKTKDELEHKIRKRDAELIMTINALKDEIEKNRESQAALQKSQVLMRELSRKILDAQENERKLIAQEIHDSISGSLAAIKLALEEKHDSMEKNPSPKVISLEKIIFQVHETIKECRRISAHLRPHLLDDLGLLSTISWFCREFEQLHPEIQVEQQLYIGEDEIPEKLKVIIYRVMQEAMNNVDRHSNATRVLVELVKRGSRIELKIADNGRGFDAEKQVLDSTALSGYGLTGMRDRTILCDGKFEIFSKKKKGTSVCISLPLSS